MSKPVTSSYSGQSDYGYETKTPALNTEHSYPASETQFELITTPNVLSAQIDEIYHASAEEETITNYSTEAFEKIHNNLLEEIRNNQTKLDFLVKETYWPLVKQAQKVSCCAKSKIINISDIYFKLAKYNYYRKNHQNADEHWYKGRNYLQVYHTYRHTEPQVNYDVWVKSCDFYIFQVYLCERKIKTIPKENKIYFINKALECINRAVQIQPNQDTLGRKFLCLQLLDVEGQKPKESYMLCMWLYLSSFDDTTSITYLKHAQRYGDLLINQKDLKEAKEWFKDLLQKKTSPIFYLYLGRIEDKLRNYKAALDFFQKALELESQNNEIIVWFNFQKIKNVIYEIQTAKESPNQQKIKEIMSVCKGFFSAFSKIPSKSLAEETSTHISLRMLISDLYKQIVPDISDLLLQLQKFELALELHNHILQFFDEFVVSGSLQESDKVKIYTTKGYLLTLARDFQKAESDLKTALQLNRKYLGAYLNLIYVYAHQKKGETELSALEEELQPLIENPSQEQLIIISNIFLNLGTAYLFSGQNGAEKAVACFEKSLEFDGDNWNTKLSLARELAIMDRFQEAQELLNPHAYQNNTSLTPFGDFRQRDFQFYFCLAGILALVGDIKTAEKWAIEAGKTRINPGETTNLQNYLKELKKPDSDKTKFHPLIKESIRKIEFSFRIGKIIDDKSISIDKDSFVGYHGTIDSYLDDFKEGIKPKRTQTRQFNGSGFYIAKDHEIACYFAMKKKKEEGRGNPILLKLYATQNLVGKEVHPTFKPPSKMETQYDFLKSVIDGFEDFPQYYVFENNLQKINTSPDSEQVTWSEENYQQFIKARTSNYRC